MLNWSVLNNSIQRFFELSPARNDRYYIDWDIMRTNIWLAVNKVSNAENFEALYSIASFYKEWHGTVENKILFSALNDVRERFGDTAINILLEVFAEAGYIVQDNRRRKEAAISIMIADGFRDIFPELGFVNREATIENGRVDILAKEPLSNRDVILEVKLGSSDPTQQLLNYGQCFKHAILIGVTDRRLCEHLHHKDIHYFTYAELNMRAAANICKRYSKDTSKMIYYPRSFDKEMETIRDTVTAN